MLIQKLRHRHRPRQGKKQSCKKKSSVRHSRAIQRDRQKHLLTPPPAEQLTARLGEWFKPTPTEEKEWTKSVGLRLRKLTLSVMVALVLSLIWRQIGGGGSEAARLLQLEGLLWVPLLVISQQAISLRLRTFPAELFLHLLGSRLERLHSLRQTQREHLPPVLAWAAQRYSTILASDGSTLDVLLRKVGLWRDTDPAPLAGKMLTLLNVSTLLPTAIWFEAQATAHDQRFWPQLLTALPAGALLLVDAGFTCFKRLAELSAFDPQVTFIIPAKSNLVYEVKRCFYKTPQVHDYLVWVGTGQDRQLLRLVKLFDQGTCYRYLTNELDPQRLPAPYIAALYEQRWRIEEVFHLVKRLLGLSYFWTGAQNGVELQVWATWMVYTVLLDLTDAVAKALRQPLRAISVEMVYRGLYYFGQACLRGLADDPIAYLVRHAKLLGILKRDPPASTHWFNLTSLPEP